MSMRIRNTIAPSQITPESVYLGRRQLLKVLGVGATTWLAGCGEKSASDGAPADVVAGAPLNVATRSDSAGGERATRYKDATNYNNYYEFGTDKGDPVQTSGRFRPKPWSVEIAGAAEIVGTFALEDLLADRALEERIYRMRCVEGWSMVIPWVGFALGDLIKRFKPTAQAKYVAFTTVNRPAEMPGLRYPALDWPYREGLRIDEAMHPLSLLAVGMYGHELPNQNGAPLRLVVPWKYGFKGIKGIVKIEFVEKQPYTSWSGANADEYGFFSNVNPEVNHPRWSQATERRISGDGSSLFASRIATRPFNGYAEQVAGLYAGMDLHKNY